MFEAHTDWAERPCWYVVAHHRTRRAWLAGPYRTAAEAEAVLPGAVLWAYKRSGDERAGHYSYAVHEHFDGGTRSILGEVAP